VRRCYVYIMASSSRTLYVGMTNNLVRRVLEHKSRAAGAFCTRYNIRRLVFIEDADGPSAAIEREKQNQGLAALAKSRTH
jgi:putative endonuclease